MSALISAEGHLHYLPKTAPAGTPPCVIEPSSLKLIDNRIVRYDETDDTLLAQSAFQCQTSAGLFRWHVYVNHDPNGSWLRAISQERPEEACIIEDTLSFSLVEDEEDALPPRIKRLIRQEVQQALQEEGHVKEASQQREQPTLTKWQRFKHTMNTRTSSIIVGTVVFISVVRVLIHGL